MKVSFRLMGSERNLALEIIPETDFERSFTELMSQTLPHTQPCCLEQHLLLETKMILIPKKEFPNDKH